MKKNYLFYLLAAILITCGAQSKLMAQSFIQEFDDLNQIAGWDTINMSNPHGPSGWFQGNSSLTIVPLSGTGFVAADLQNTDAVGTGDISNWLIAPMRTLKNGDVIHFYTTTVVGSLRPDRLQVLLSTNGASADVGLSELTTGDFTTVLLDINPSLTVGGYPETWTGYTITLSGLPALGVDGRFAFRYFVSNGGFAGANSQYIGLDSISFCDIPAQPGTITGATTVCDASNQTYSIAAVAGATSYEWTLPSGWSGTSTTNSITVTAGSAGGDITVTATNACGTSIAQTLTVAVTSGLVSGATISGNNSICSGSTNTYSVTPVAGATSYNWALPFNWTGTSTTNSISAVAAGGSGDVMLTVTNACGTSAPQSYHVTVFSGVPSQPISVLGSTSVCSGTSTTYMVSSVTGATSYNWTLPSGWSGTSTTNSIVVTTGTVGGTISVNAANGCGAGTSRTLMVAVYQSPAQPTVINGTTAICNGQPYTYSITPVAGATYYSWFMPPGWSAASSTQTITGTPGSSGTISVTAHTASCASLPQTLAVTVSAIPGQPGTIQGAATVCTGTSALFYIAPLAGATTYNWTLPSGWSGTSTIDSINATSNGSGGTVSVTGTNFCGTSPVRTLAVSANVAPAQPVSMSGSINVCSGANENYTVDSVLGATSYVWTLPSGWSGTSATNTITATVGNLNTNDTIYVAASNGCGMSANLSFAVTVNTLLPAQPGNITGNNTVCPGSTQMYYITPVAGATSYLWTLPSGWSGISTMDTITVTAGTIAGDISVAAYNGTCSSSAPSTLTVSLFDAPAQPGIISGPASFCPGQTSLYYIDSIPGATGYVWTLPNGWTGSSVTDSITVTTNSTGGVLSVASINSCGTSVDQTLTIVADSVPAQPLSISGVNAICQGNSDVYSITQFSGATSYNWSLPPGWTGSSNTNSISATAVGVSGDLTVSVTNVCGTSPSQTLNISVNSGAPVQPGIIFGNTTICEALTTTYSVSPVAEATSYNWVLPSGWSGTSTTNSIDVTVGATSGDVSVQAVNGCGASTAQTITVSVDPSPAVPSVIYGPANICSGISSLYYIDPVSGATSYTWNMPTGWSATSFNDSTLGTPGISGNITVIAHNATCSSAAQTFAVTVNTVPSQPGAITGATSLCEGSTEVYSISPIANTTSYLWTLPSGWSGTSATENINATLASNSGNVIVYAVNECGNSASQSLVVTANVIPAQPSVINGPMTVCSGTNFDYYIAPVANATSYTWTMPSDWTGSSLTDSLTVITGVSAGTITVIANNGICASAAQSITVSIDSLPVQPGMITGSAVFCPGQTLTYSIAPIAAVFSFNWTLPSGWSGASTSNTIVAITNTNADTIRLSYSNACGTSPVQTLAVALGNAPAQSSIIIGDTTFCPSQTKVFTIDSIAGATSYVWTLPSGWSGTSTTNSITAVTNTNGGVISVAGINDCGTGLTQFITVTADSALTQPVSISGSTLVCAGAVNTYSISPVSGALSYNWILPNGWTGSSSTNSISATAAGVSGDIIVFVTNFCGTSPPQSLHVDVNNGVPAQPGSILGGTTVCSGTDVGFMVSTVPGVTSYNWTLPSGWSGTSTSNSILATIGTAGGTLTVSANNGCGTSIDQTLVVAVNQSPAQPTVINGPTTLCLGVAQTYSIDTVAGATSYSWYMPPGWSAFSTSQAITGTPGSSGNITVTAHTSTCASLPQSLAVTVNAIPVQPVSISGTSVLCTGSSQNYVITPVAGATSYIWDVPAAWTGSSTTDSLSAIVVGNNNDDTLLVYAVNGCGMSPVQSLIITVNATPIQPDTILGPNALCSGSAAIYFIAPVNGATSYTWNLPSGWPGNSATSSISTTVGSASANLSVSSSNACGTSNVQNLFVTISVGLPAQPGAISGNSPICVGSQNTYTIAPVTGATSYIWTLPSGWTGTSTSTSIIATASTASGNVIVNAVNGCGINYNSSMLSVSTLGPPPVPTITVSGDTLFSSSATGYQWNLNGVAITSATSQYYIPAFGGNYTVTVTNIAGCTSTSSPQTVLSVNENEMANVFVVYPNPSHDVINIKLMTNQTVEDAFITNVLGKTVFVINPKSLKNKDVYQLDLNGLSQGVYFLNIQSNGRLNTQKLVID